MNDLLTFIDQSPSPFHAVDTLAKTLSAAGYTRLSESSPWHLAPGGKYFVTRNGSSLLAFRIPRADFTGFLFSASHSDAPTFRVKENAEMEGPDGYLRLNTEGYGGMLCAPWLDRPLTVAGRALVQKGDTIETRLVYVDRDLLMIPNVAIHMNREANNGYKYDLKCDMVPLLGLGKSKGAFKAAVAQAAACAPADILGWDLVLAPRQKGLIWGMENEFISSPRLDDLQCAYGCFQGFLTAADSDSVPVFALLDNEEVGSRTKQGADSTFLSDLVERICAALGRDRATAVANSFLVSADNAHGVHPNYGEKADPTNRPWVNGGIVIKYNANQKYSTDGISAAAFKTICQKAQVPWQTFANRSDMAGGSTLGNIANCHVSINTVDIGLPQLAMHSPYETAGVKDTWYLVKAAKAFFDTSFVPEGRGGYRLG